MPVKLFEPMRENGFKNYRAGWIHLLPRIKNVLGEKLSVVREVFLIRYRTWHRSASSKSEITITARLTFKLLKSRGRQFFQRRRRDIFVETQTKIPQPRRGGIRL